MTSAPVLPQFLLLAGTAVVTCAPALWSYGGIAGNALIAAVAVQAAVFATVVFIMYLSWAYGAMMRRNSLNVDTYTGKQPSFKDRVGVAFTHWMAAGLGAASSRHTPSDPVPLEAMPSSFVDKLKVNHDSTSAAAISLRGGATGGGGTPRLAIRSSRGGTIFVGTIRMGFGHHRIAYAASSWGLDAGMGTYFHDLLNIKSREAGIIKKADGLYSYCSRLASELGGVAEKMWGAMTLSGDENSLRSSWQMAEELKPLMMELDKDVPVITSHSLVGMTAVACGFKHVINLVIDNWAQWFVVVPGAINLVQGPSNYEALLRMGVPPDQVRLAGHWVPKGVHKTIGQDCRSRIARASSGVSARRLLVPVGGAGAQRKFVSGFVRNLLEPLKDGRVRLLLNAGDHASMQNSLKKCLEELGIGFKVISDFDEMKALIARLHLSVQDGEDGGNEAFMKRVLAAEEGLPPVIMFAFDDYFPAVAATDLLVPVADILCCKPSELAFYPLPKLMIRRVGDHEAHSATRAAEIGDGTPEVRTLESAAHYVEMLCSKERPDLFVSMNQQIIKNLSIGIYDGCKVAVELAAELAKL
ncbi:unnamed protein product [Ectocarpus fasciculatus]